MSDPRPCLTPGAVYSVGGDEFGSIHVTVRVPRSSFRALQYMRGLYGVKYNKRSAPFATTDNEKLRRYDEAEAERKRISQIFHDALEPVIADFYKAIWNDCFAGRVVDGEMMPPTYDEYLHGDHK